MDATTRWETEAIRSKKQDRSGPPRPTAKRRTTRRGGEWMTLKEAEQATGIPANTIRKWVRKDTVDSYLESDGELALRMVNLDSIKARAQELGREIVPDLQDPEIEDAAIQAPKTVAPAIGAPDAQPPAAKVQESAAETTETPAHAVGPDTMLVPVDAWNKMLNQLGNLHEAGQQLADARERAAKAETEAQFLRERLRELRIETVTQPEVEPQPEPEPVVATEKPSPDPTPERQTTTYWRYLTTGWRNRR